MSAFFWTAGHLGWGFFAALAYTGAGCLVGDLVWRCTHASTRKLLVALAFCWLAGIALIVWLAQWLA